jgi:hypothetical protein
MHFLDQLDPELRVVLEAMPTEGAVDLHEKPRDETHGWVLSVLRQRPYPCAWRFKHLPQCI